MASARTRRAVRSRSECGVASWRVCSASSAALALVELPGLLLEPLPRVVRAHEKPVSPDSPDLKLPTWRHEPAGTVTVPAVRARTTASAASGVRSVPSGATRGPGSSSTSPRTGPWTSALQVNLAHPLLSGALSGVSMGSAMEETGPAPVDDGSAVHLFTVESFDMFFRREYTRLVIALVRAQRLPRAGRGRRPGERGDGLPALGRDLPDGAARRPTSARCASTGRRRRSGDGSPRGVRCCGWPGDPRVRDHPGGQREVLERGPPVADQAGADGCSALRVRPVGRGDRGGARYGRRNGEEPSAPGTEHARRAVPART